MLSEDSFFSLTNVNTAFSLHFRDKKVFVNIFHNYDIFMTVNKKHGNS